MRGGSVVGQWGRFVLIFYSLKAGDGIIDIFTLDGLSGFEIQKGQKQHQYTSDRNRNKHQHFLPQNNSKSQ
jgi:hypothetical protein